MRRLRLLGLLMALLLAVGWWFFLISPRNERITEARDGLQVARQQEVTLRGQIARLQEIRDAQVEYLAGIGKMEALIPQRPLLDEFIDGIYGLSNATGVELFNLAAAPPQIMSESELRQITVEVTLDGDFFEVLGFLFGVMDMDRLVRVDSISAASSQDEAGATVLSVSLGLRLFTLSDLVPVSTTTTVPGTGVTPGDASTGGEASPSLGTTVPTGEG
jgi:Tfp pilus assembly protein PilO